MLSSFSNFCRPIVKEISFDELTDIIVGQSQNSSAKISLIFQENALNCLQYLYNKSVKWHQLKNINFYVSQIGFFFFPNNFFLNIIDIETQRLTSVGIMNYLVNLVYKDKYPFESIKEWKVLTMEKLQFGFVIWLCSCAVTVVIFVTEVMFWIAIRRAKIRLKRYLRNKRNKIPVIYPVKVRVSKKQSVCQ